jgi:hypothetical protein
MRNSFFITWNREKGGKIKKLWKNPVDFSTVLYTVEYDLVIGCNLTPDPVLSGTDAIVMFKTHHLVDIKNRGKCYLMRGSGQRPAVQSGHDSVFLLQRDLSRRSSYIRTPAFQSFFNDR